MPYEAKHRFARIAPRKARLIMDLIRGRDVDDALSILRFSKQRASGMVEKVIRSAVANANEQDTAPSRNTFYVAKAWVDPGPVIKRSSHLVVTVDERAEGEIDRSKHLGGSRQGKARR